MTSTPLSQLEQLIPLLIPIFIIQVVLMVAALLDLRKQTTTRGPRWLWWVVIPFVNIIGPILYFAIGRKED
jgi:hypothetical protein